MADVASYLVKSRTLTAEGAAQALAAAQDGDVASAALRLGLATEGALVLALVDLHDCPGVDLSRSVIPGDQPLGGLLRLLPAAARPAGLGGEGRAGAGHGRAGERDAGRRAALRHRQEGAALRRRAGRHRAGHRRPGAREAALRARPGGARRRRRSRTRPPPGWAWSTAPASPAGRIRLELPEASEEIELVPITQQLETPFAAPSPARLTRPSELRAGLAAPRGVAAATTTCGWRERGPASWCWSPTPAAMPARSSRSCSAKLGCTVLQAANGRGALDITREARPDLVVIEAMLPMVQGFDVCRAIKGDPVLRADAGGADERGPPRHRGGRRAAGLRRRRLPGEAAPPRGGDPAREGAATRAGRGPGRRGTAGRGGGGLAGRGGGAGRGEAGGGDRPAARGLRPRRVLRRGPLLPGPGAGAAGAALRGGRGLLALHRAAPRRRRRPPAPGPDLGAARLPEERPRGLGARHRDLHRRGRARRRCRRGCSSCWGCRELDGAEGFNASWCRSVSYVSHGSQSLTVQRP